RGTTVNQMKRPAPSIVPRTLLMYAVVGFGIGAIPFGAACSSSDSGSGSSSGSGGADSGSSSGNSSSGSSSSGGSSGAPAGDATGTLILLAYGGASGKVAAEVTFPEPGV